MEKGLNNIHTSFKNMANAEKKFNISLFILLLILAYFIYEGNGGGAVIMFIIILIVMIMKDEIIRKIISRWI